MRLSFKAIATLATGMTLALVPLGAAAQAGADPLIPRAALFGNPAKASARISPDGKWLSWLAPVDGVLNIWVAPAANPAAAKPVSASKDRPVRTYFWAPDSRSVLYIQDKGGDENFLLYGIDPVSAKERLLTPFEKTTVRLIGTSTLHRNRILVGLNNRDPKFHDVHSLDLNTGKLTLVLQNTGGFGEFTADNNLIIRLASKPNAKGGTDYFKVTNGAIATKPFSVTELDDALSTAPIGFTTNGKTLYWIESRGRNTAALVAQDFARGTTRVVAEDRRADIEDVLSDPVTGEVEAYAVDYLRNEWTAIDPAIGRSLALLKEKLKGDIDILSRTDQDDRWIVASDPVTEPGKTWLFERKTGRLSALFTSRPELVGAPLAAMYPREIKARDGLTLVSYLTLPHGSDPDGDGVPTKAVPMVLLVHGGPWGRDNYGSSRQHHLFANRGYAVLSVNFRASTGFGKDFIKAGNMQWGRAMHDDLIDAVDWAIAQGIAIPDKVAIMGGSYGGYAALAGVTFTPTKFACGVDIVGPSNLETLLNTIPPYWEAIREQFYQRMGNPNTPEGVALLKERSPLYKAGNIVRPLLIGQGANDPRVNQAESDQIVEAMKARNIPVSYVLFPDEGHGFARPANNIAFTAVAENFLASCLGGRAEPIGDTLKQSTAKVPEGAQHVPGLAEALAR